MKHNKQLLPLRSPEGKPKIGLVLSGGGARGNIYIGVYQELIKNNIPVDVITGVSQGAIAAGAIALGLTPNQWKQGTLDYGHQNPFSWKYLNFFHEGIFNDEPFYKGSEKFFNKKALIEECKIPFGCHAVNLESGKIVEFTKGNLTEAIRASMSIPFIFQPKFINNRYLVDGGTLNNAPVDLCRRLGADKTIVFRMRSNISSQQIAGEIFQRYVCKKKQFDLFNGSFATINNLKANITFFMEIMMDGLGTGSYYTTSALLKEAKPDILLEPLVNIGFLDYDEENVNKAIEIGKKCIQDNLDEIKSLTHIKK